MPKRILTGKVVSNKMTKTSVLLVERHPAHPLYKKVQSKRKKFKFHDEQEMCQEGDIVRIIECRPLSKEKHYRLLDIINRAAK